MDFLFCTKPGKVPKLSNRPTLGQHIKFLQPNILIEIRQRSNQCLYHYPIRECFVGEHNLVFPPAIIHSAVQFFDCPGAVLACSSSPDLYDNLLLTRCSMDYFVSTFNLQSHNGCTCWWWTHVINSGPKTKIKNTKYIYVPVSSFLKTNSSLLTITLSSMASRCRDTYHATL